MNIQGWKKGVALISLTLAVIMLMAGCSGNTQEAGAASKEKIKVNVAINGGITPLSIVKDKGWLEEEFKALNAEVEWSEFASGPPLLEALVANRVDLSFLGDGATISGASSGLPFQVIGLVSEGRKTSGVLVPAASSIQSVEELKGKKIGLAKGTTAHVYLLKALSNHGLTGADITIINLQPDDAAAAFAGGQLDAWVTWDPYITVQTSNGQARNITNENENILAPTSMIGRTDFLKKHADLTVAYLKVYKRAAEWMVANKDESVAFFAKQKKIPEATLKSMLESSSATLDLYNEEMIAGQQQSANILLENGFIKKEVDFKALVNNDLLKEALK